MEHEEHELQTMKETEKANALRKVARNNNDTSHVELLAHSQQSRPPVDTTSTIQQTDPVHHIIHSDTDSGYETAVEGYSRQEVHNIREEAELEQKVMRTASENKLNRLAVSNAKVIGDINLLWNTRHQKAQEALQRELQISSDSHQVMANYQNQIQDQRHQAELRQLSNQYQGLHQELARYRDREEELTRWQSDLTARETHSPNKVRVITRELANEPFNALSSSSTEIVPMATAPPTRAESLATLQSKAPPPQPSLDAMRQSLQTKAPPPKQIGPIATAPPPKAPTNRPRAKSGEAIPRTRDALIQYLLARGVQLTEAQMSGPQGTKLTVPQLTAMARTQ